MPKPFVFAVMLATTSSCADSPCSKSDREGVWFADTKTLSGDCGELPDYILTPSYDNPYGCVADRQWWSDDECAYEVAMTCVVDTGHLKYTGRTEEVDEDTFTGLIELQFLDRFSVEVCRGVYEIKYMRLQSGK